MIFAIEYKEKWSIINQVNELILKFNEKGTYKTPRLCKAMSKFDKKGRGRRFPQSFFEETQHFPKKSVIRNGK